jgi:ribonuclease HI
MSQPANDPADQTLRDLIAQLQIERWDFLIIGDGSGSNFSRHCGWASVSIEQLTGERLIWYGAMNHGTVNLAELMAYLQPINWIAGRLQQRRRKHSQHFQECHIHCISDSKYCVENGQTEAMPARNLGFWTLAQSYRQQQIFLHWHWSQRASFALNQWADQIARISRRCIGEIDKQLADAVEDVYQINAEE